MRTPRLLLGLAGATVAVLVMAAAPPRKPAGVTPFVGRAKAALEAAPEMPHGPVVDRLRKALAMTIDIDFSPVDPKDMRLGNILDIIQKQTKLAFLAPRAEDSEDRVKMKHFTMNGPLTLGAFLAFLDDHINEERPVVTFIVREYGLRAVPPSRVPAGAMTLREFRKRCPDVAE